MQKSDERTIQSCLNDLISLVAGNNIDAFSISCLAAIQDERLAGLKQYIVELFQKPKEDSDLNTLALLHGIRWTIDPQDVDGALLARITKKLIAAEVAPSGPYRSTHGIDPGLNAMIAWMLNIQGIQLTGLQNYIAGCISRGEYLSEYYSHPAVVAYLFSRTQLSENSKVLLGLHAEILMNDLAYTDDILTLACTIQVLIRCNPESLRIEQAIEELCARIQLAGLNIEGYASALAIEALHLYLHQIIHDLQACQYRLMLQEKIEGFIASQPKQLAKDISELLPAIIAKDTRGEICMMAYACSYILSSPKRMALLDLASLGLASLLGWAAYSIYDDIIDEQSNIGLLPTANVCAREIQLIYEQLGFGETARAITSLMDNANALEFGNRKIGQELSTAMIADRGMGHAIGLLTQFHHAGYTKESKEYLAIEASFREYIIAKQLHDDAHDWEEDLLRGVITYPVRLLLEREQLYLTDRQYFLSYGMAIVSQRILKHLQQAEDFLQQVPALNAEPFIQYILPLRNGAQRAIRQSEEMLFFLDALELQAT